MIKFLHTADIHLDSPLHRLEVYEGAPVEAVRRASRRAFENFVDLALDEGVDFILIAGDLFDGDWKDYNTGLYFVGQMQRLDAAGISVWIVTGNHDAAGRMTRGLPYPDNVYVFSHKKAETRRMESLRVAVHGRSFETAAVTENLAAGYPAPVPGFFNIGLLHTGLTGREGHEPYAPCTTDDLLSRGYDYWGLGHVHAYEQVCHTPPVIFPGCLQGRHARETGPKGAVLVTLREGGEPVVDFHALDVVRWMQLRVDLKGASTRRESLDRFAEALTEGVRSQNTGLLVVRVVFEGTTAAHARILGDPVYFREAVRSTALAGFGDGVWVEKVKIRTRPFNAESSRTADPGPLMELERMAAGIQADDAALLSLGDSLSGLFRKLPAEYRAGADALDPSCLDHLRRLVEEARRMLVQGLAKEPE